MRVAVVGATGAVGREMLRILHERAFPADEVLAFATERSQGRRVPFGPGELVVAANRPGALEGVDLALWSAGGAASRELLPAAAEAGTINIDNSSAWRMADGVPLVIPEVNAEAVHGHTGIIANPNCTAIAALVPLAPLHREFGVRELILSSYQSVSGIGTKGIRELAEQVEKLRGQEETLGHPTERACPRARCSARRSPSMWCRGSTSSWRTGSRSRSARSATRPARCWACPISPSPPRACAFR